MSVIDSFSNSVGWAGWAHAHPDSGRIEGAAGQWRRAALLLATQFQEAIDAPVKITNENSFDYKKFKVFTCWVSDITHKTGMVSFMNGPSGFAMGIRDCV